MKQIVLKVHPKDNVLVALQDLAKGQIIPYNGNEYTLVEDIPAKHKFTTESLPIGGAVTMYGVLIGKAKEDIPVGTRISTSNLKHAAEEYQLSDQRRTSWHIPDVSRWQQKLYGISPG
ncbi:UxaA family hydrolase [Paraflavitalea speifideaquila]|uniref:UxaA family hydrolase n=1 Tax=Paraflavitalea speifideaquila TaxID=3076558 RepID=UPI0028EB1A82|nr:UxaA family hydrolase [Paraflavitalea speifideiaquila]